MVFVSPIFGLGVQRPQQIQIPYPTIVQQPVISVVPQPHFLFQPQVQVQVQVYQPPPVSMMVPTMAAYPSFFTPPCFIVTPAQPSPGADTHQSSGISLRVVFYGHPSDDVYTLPMCISSTTYAESALPSRDALLAKIAILAGHHGLAIRHPGGRIDPFRVKLYVLPKSSSSRGQLSGMSYEPGAGLVVPGDVVKMVKLGGIEEKDWEEALKEIEKEGHKAVVAMDMSDGGSNTTTTSTSTSPTTRGSTPEPDASGNQTAAAA